MKIKNSRAVVGLVGVAAIALSMAACGSQKSENPTAGSTVAANTTVDPKLVAMLPAAIKTKGALTVGTDSTYPPSEYLDTDGKTVIGFDVDLFNAVAKKLGLTTTYQSADFDTIIPGVQSGKYDIGVSSFTINADRMKVADMISYFTAGMQWVTAPGTTIDPNNACGKKVAVQKDTTEQADLATKSKACTDAGKAAIHVDPFVKQDDATTAVVTGKDDAMSADFPVCIDAVNKSSGKLAIDGDQYGDAPYGYVIPKNDGQLAQAIQGAVQDLITDGTYNTILTTWKVQQGAIPTSQINPTS
jgi:polar amino acid transport system substrate-binding protein